MAISIVGQGGSVSTAEAILPIDQTSETTGFASSGEAIIVD